MGLGSKRAKCSGFTELTINRLVICVIGEESAQVGVYQLEKERYVNLRVSRTCLEEKARFTRRPYIAKQIGSAERLNRQLEEKPSGDAQGLGAAQKHVGGGRRDNYISEPEFRERAREDVVEAFFSTNESGHVRVFALQVFAHIARQRNGRRIPPAVIFDTGV